jgi:hypothetical protein
VGTEKELAHYKLVVHFKDGRLIKGTSFKLDPRTKGFYLLLRQTSDKMQEEVYVEFADLKAIFFVKNFDGKPLEDQTVRKEYVPEGHEITVRFKDGEILEGFALGGYIDSSERFYVDLRSGKDNNYAALVERLAVKDLVLGKVFRKKELHSIVDTPVKRVILSYYWRNQGLVTTIEGIAAAIERTPHIVQRDIRSFFNEGLMRPVEEEGIEKVRFLPPPDDETKEFVARNAK